MWTGEHSLPLLPWSAVVLESVPESTIAAQRVESAFERSSTGSEARIVAPVSPSVVGGGGARPSKPDASTSPTSPVATLLTPTPAPKKGVSVGAKRALSSTVSGGGPLSTAGPASQEDEGSAGEMKRLMAENAALREQMKGEASGSAAGSK